MTTEDAGYVTDVPYAAGWYRQQSPAMMALACLSRGIDVPLPAPDAAPHVLELGCGLGYGAMMLAASNPAWFVTAIDFNPTHIAAARAWAARAGLGNIRFIEASLASLAGDSVAETIPGADFVTMHGVWSWVSPAVQAGIVRLLRAKVRPGGAVHVSFNALPAWGPALGLRRLVFEAGKRLASGSDRQAMAGLRAAQDLATAAAWQLSGQRGLIERLSGLPAAYLAHEYMNESWQPCFLADVAAALAGAELEWAAASMLTENIPALTLTPAQAGIAERFEDPLLRELVKDMCLRRPVRHDVFVRAPRRLDAAARDDALRRTVLGLTVHPAEFPMQVRAPAGGMTLDDRFLRPIVEALGDGPASAGALLSLPDLEGRRLNPAELIAALVGMDFAEPLTRPGASPGEAAMRFNRVSAHVLAETEPLDRTIGLASERLGAGTDATLLEALAVDAMRDGDLDRDAFVRGLDPPPAQAPRIRAALDHAAGWRVPVLRGLGVF